MLKLLRFAKPYWLMLVLSIVLLFAQANFDLALPDYLSRIVNTGIQQGGVEDALPVAIRASDRCMAGASDRGRSVRPIDPAKRQSPPNATPCP